MNRENEFRVWDIKEKYFRDVEFDEQEFHLGFFIDHAGDLGKEDLIWEQYTGLKDSKRTEEFSEGQKIFEGDILKFKYGVGLVYYENGCFKIAFDIDNDLLWLYCCKGDQTFIIGNIHQTPELLNENN